MKKSRYFVFIIMIIIFASSCKDTQVPRVVKTFPVNGSQDVDPSITELHVVFNEEMKDGNYSWAMEDNTNFPTMTGQPYFDKSMTKNSLPVKLEPDTQYVIWFNNQKFQNFKDKSGNVLVPFRFTFKTK